MKDLTMLKGKKIINTENGNIRLVTDVDTELNKLYIVPLDKDYAVPTPMAYASFTRRWTVLEETAESEQLPEEPIAAEPETEAAPVVEDKPKAKKTKKTAKPKAEEPKAEETKPEEPVAEEPKTAEPKRIDAAKVLDKTDDAEPMTMAGVITKLEDLFDILNKAYFDNALPKPVITVQSTPKAFGHCSTKKIWRDDRFERYEINIGAEFLNRPSADTAATMCHEMVHLYCLENEIADTCQHGRYHNKTFKTECELRDLQVDYDRANGYTHTSPTDAFKKTLEEAEFVLEVLFARVPPKEKVKAERERPHKYVYPVCGQTVKSTSDLHIICAICDVAMERED